MFMAFHAHLWLGYDWKKMKKEQPHSGLLAVNKIWSYCWWKKPLHFSTQDFFHQHWETYEPLFKAVQFGTKVTASCKDPNRRDPIGMKLQPSSAHAAHKGERPRKSPSFSGLAGRRLSAGRRKLCHMVLLFNEMPWTDVNAGVNTY